MNTWEEAVRWCIETPEMADLARNAYFGDPVEAAERYYQSEEFAALRNLLPSKSGRALDLGAGNGILAYSLAKEGWQVTAIEPDPSPLVGAGAIRDLVARTGTDIQVIEAMGEDIPLDTANFNLVVARQVLHHARDLDAFCCEMARLGSPGATVITLRDHVISSEFQRQNFYDRHPLHHLYGGENAFTLAQYRAALTGAGLKIAREIGSFDSVLNYAPMKPSDIRHKIAQSAGPLSGCAKALLTLTPFALIRRLATIIDRRPGRLVSFIAKKDSES
jgi:SAM-dependent methyltransferase